MQEILERYEDEKEVGIFGFLDTSTMKETEVGKVFATTIKVRQQDGSIGLTHELEFRETP